MSISVELPAEAVLKDPSLMRKVHTTIANVLEDFCEQQAQKAFDEEHAVSDYCMKRVYGLMDDKERACYREMWCDAYTYKLQKKQKRERAERMGARETVLAKASKILQEEKNWYPMMKAQLLVSTIEDSKSEGGGGLRSADEYTKMVEELTSSTPTIDIEEHILVEKGLVYEDPNTSTVERPVFRLKDDSLVGFNNAAKMLQRQKRYRGNELFEEEEEEPLAKRVKAE